MDYNKVAKEVISHVGGPKNIKKAFHCATRLRLMLKDPSLVDEKALESVDGVKGTFLVQEQFQIIFGSGTVNLVTDEVLKELGMDSQDQADEEIIEKKGNPISRAVKTLSDIFVPIVPAIVAGGLLMGINNVITAQGLFFANKSLIEAYPMWKDFATIINLFSNAAFTFLPILVGFSATKKFGGNPYLGAVMGMIMVHPDLLNCYNYGKVATPFWNLFGLKVAAVGYQGTVLPILFVSWLIAKLETKLHKITPSWLDNLTTPLLSVLITGFITFLAVGPVLREAGNVLADGLQWLYFSLGPVGGAIFGFLYAPIVITGMHQSFIAIETQLLASAAHRTFIFPIATMSNVAQGAAVLAVFFLSKDAKQKSLCSASGISALLGITEPAMFGVNLKLKYPFIGAICGSAVGSAWIAGTKTLASAVGTAGIPGFISIPPESWGNYGIGMVLAIVVAFIVTCILHKRNVEGKTPAESENLAAPMKGNVAPITECPDPTFASKAMGDGFVVFPEDGKFYAPANAEVTMTFPTKHAFGLMTNDGTEILIHIGLDTVELNGEPFTMHVKKGDKVKKGQLLVDVDLKAIEAAGKETATAVVITNGKAVNLIKSGAVDAKTDVVEIANPVVEVKAA